MVRFVLVFLTSILLSVAYGSTLYVNSSFLARFFAEEWLSAIYLATAFLNIALFFLAPRFLRRFSKEELLVYFLAATGLGTLGMAMAENPVTAAISFIVSGGVIFMAYYCLDISLEELSSNGRTGAIRGLYYTFVNGGIALGPLILALIVADDSLKPIFLVSALILLTAIVSALFQMKGEKPALPHRHRERVALPLKAWWRARNVRAATFAKAALEVFFALMTIYTPIYLHAELGFPWSELGLIFTVMLIPFVVLEWPAGEAADRWWGEKEIMSVGFFLMGAMLLLMPFLGRSFSYWMVVLLVSRVGASLVEITTESYFFKKISASDVGILSIFRLTRPICLVLAAGLGAAILPFFSYPGIFFAAAIAVFLGMYEALHLRDTK